MRLEPRWELATFIAGLCCELHRTMGPLIVLNAEGREWPICLMLLADWLLDRGLDRYRDRNVLDTLVRRALALVSTAISALVPTGAAPPRVLRAEPHGQR